MSSDMNLPFEASPLTELTEQMYTCGGVAVLAAYADTPGGGKQPIIVFRFAKADGSGFLPAIALAVDQDSIESLPELIRAAVTRSVEATR